MILKGQINYILIIIALFFGGCTAGSMTFAIDKEKTTMYDVRGNVVSVTESSKINQPVAKSALATVSFLSTDSPIAGAIVAGANSIGEGIGNLFNKSGEAVGDSLSIKSQGNPVIIQYPQQQSYPIGISRPIPEAVKE